MEAPEGGDREVAGCASCQYGIIKHKSPARGDWDRTHGPIAPCGALHEG